MKINRAKLRSVGCLHFEIDLPDRYVYVDVSQGEDLPAELQAQGSNDTIM